MSEARPHLKVEVVDQLPGSDDFVILESRDQVVYRFTPEWRPTERTCQAMQESIQHLIDTTWTQQWDEPGSGPSHLRSVS